MTVVWRRASIVSSFACVYLAAPEAVMNSTSIGAVPLSQTWRPGVGTQCRGIWTQAWSDEQALRNVKLHLEEPLQRLLDSHECPYGWRLPGDVTWPSPPTDAEGMVAALDMFKIIAVFYSYVPYLLGFKAFCVLLVRRGTRQLAVVLWLLSTLLMNEVILKRLWREPRPGTMLQVRDAAGKYAGSCLHSCGMPSSHSALAMGWFVQIFLDASYRVHPLALGRKTQTIALRPGTGAFEKAIKCLRLYLWLPWIDVDIVTHTEYVVYMSAWFLILMPVPFMRVVLYDHTCSQVAVGAGVGIVFTLFWWRVVRHMQRKYHGLEGRPVFHQLLEHNYKLATFHLNGAGDITGEFFDPESNGGAMPRIPWSPGRHDDDALLRTVSSVSS